MKKIFLILSFFITNLIFSQQGGMWIPSLLKGERENEMKNLGAKISAEEIFSMNKSSIKDAVPQFNGGCTSQVISDSGLLLTNHHCGFYEVQQHSSTQNDYITNGFWAKNREEELPNARTFVTFVIKIEDVTEKVLKNTQNISEIQLKNKKIEENISEITKNYKKEDFQEVKIHSFYHSNQFLLFVTETFKDVRLVGVPPASIGKFGADTDNWIYPRHTGDFMLFRIYADKNNRPAHYSKDNVPYKPKHFLPINIEGVQESDFTMVMGYPGRTQEYLPSVAINQIVNLTNPVRIKLRDITLKIQEKFMREDNAIKIKYASKNASIANAWKKWQGENLGIEKSNAIFKIKQKENALFEKITLQNKTEYQNILKDFEKYYTEIEKYELSTQIIQEFVYRNSEILQVANRLNLLKKEANDKEKFQHKKENLLKYLENFYKDFHFPLEKEVLSALFSEYKQKMPKEFQPTNVEIFKIEDILKDTKLGDFSSIKKLLEGNSKEILQKLENEKVVNFCHQITEIYEQKITPKYTEKSQKIKDLQRLYMKAILEFSSEKDRIFPDANSTLRLTFGQVKGFSPYDATYFQPFSYLKGVQEKYIENDYEFDAPKKLLNLYKSKDYGIYADQTGEVPLCFIATNHTTGGNSGSPAMDKHGNLIGLNFDRVWQGTMSDIYYDASICRNIMVDIRYVLFIVDKFADSKYLFSEMKFKNRNNKIVKIK